MRDDQLSSIIPIELVNFGSRELHLQLEPCSPREHHEKCFPQRCKQWVPAVLLLILLQLFCLDGDSEKSRRRGLSGASEKHSYRIATSLLMLTTACDKEST